MTVSDAAQQHTSDPRILNARTVEQDFRPAFERLRPGLRVLDIGCGTGAITAGIARHVGPGGRVLGVDRDATLLAVAREAASDMPWLEFRHGDLFELTRAREFDLVVTARTLQWVDRDRLQDAASRLAAAAVPGGRVVVLDYNHHQHSWVPEPPAEFRLFFAAFLAWRDAHRWDNDVTALLPGLLTAAGVRDIASTNTTQHVVRGDSAFDSAARIWPRVIETIGPTIATAGFISEQDRQGAADLAADWFARRLHSQTMAARTITGTIPQE